MDEYKEVYFYAYCPICEYRDLSANEEPCEACLCNPINVHSHKPVKWKEIE